MTHIKAIFLSGLVWMAVGAGLLYKGLNFLVNCIDVSSFGWPVKAAMNWGKNPEQASLIVICAALFVGFLKGRIILSRTAKRVTDYILSQHLPLTFNTIFPKPYLMMILGMMLLGMSLKFLPITDDWRGFVDVAVGSALMNGAMIYFRNALGVRGGVYR